jgi:hypothetical protein
MLVAMPARRQIAVAAPATVMAVALASLIWPSGATSARPCQTLDPKTQRPLRAVLTLDDQAAVTNRTLERSTRERTLSLVFRISHCVLYDAKPRPSLLTVPAKGGDDLPHNALTVEQAFVNGSTLFLLLQIHPKQIDPGTYNSFVIATAPYLGANRTAVTVSRSEDAEWKVLLVGLLAAISGLVWLLVLAIPVVDSSAFKSWRTLALCFLAITAGVYAAATNYYGQEVWTFSDNIWGLTTAAFVAASSGSIAAVLIGSKSGRSGSR